MFLKINFEDNRRERYVWRRVTDIKAKGVSLLSLSQWSLCLKIVFLHKKGLYAKSTKNKQNHWLEYQVVYDFHRTAIQSFLTLIYFHCQLNGSLTRALSEMIEIFIPNGCAFFAVHILSLLCESLKHWMVYNVILERNFYSNSERILTHRLRGQSSHSNDTQC